MGTILCCPACGIEVLGSVANNDAHGCACHDWLNVLVLVYCTGPPCPADHNNSASAASAPKLVEASVQLFNITADPTESSNLAAAHPDVVKMLTALVTQYNRTAASSAQQGLPDDPRADPKLHNNTISPWL